MATKKLLKSKIRPEDVSEFLNKSEFLKDSPKVKTQKHQKKEQFDVEEDDISKLIGQYQNSAKRKKVEANVESSKESRNKIICLVDHQLEARKHCNENLFKGLGEITTQIEADYNAMKENEQKLEQLTGTYMKCIQQATTAYKQKFKALKELHATFKNAAQGLIAKSGIKPDDRPIWFDVYRAFPPFDEPKFSKPKPEITPIRPILYKEDVLRAKFHSQGHGLGAINLQSTGDTQTKRLIQQYEKLKAEGVPEEELVEKSAIAVGIERREQYEASKAERTLTEPGNSQSQSASGQVLAEANLKNIFT